MKRLTSIAAIAAGILSITACGNNSSENFTDRFEKFINDSEKEISDFTEENWEKAEKEFNEFVEYFNENADKFTDEQREKINKAIGKFEGMKAKHKLEDFADKVEGFIEGLTQDDSDSTATEKEDRKK